LKVVLRRWKEAGGGNCGPESESARDPSDPEVAQLLPDPAMILNPQRQVVQANKALAGLL